MSSKVDTGYTSRTLVPLTNLFDCRSGERFKMFTVIMNHIQVIAKQKRIWFSSNKSNPKK